MTVPIVEIKEGKLQGDTGINLNGELFFRFKGIPYAKPPVGALRFKVAEPVEPWTGVKNATKNGDCCFQKNFMTNDLLGSEDCLNLNVFAKELPTAKENLKPVMVYIHGGAFTMGSNDADMMGPEYLITEDIVLVVINYRLGVLGFLSAQDSSVNITENNGLKDQTLALKWVQKNISYFGGDPNNVTIFGHSAGAASVHFHVLSPLSKGLFHKAILHSGCALNPWAWGNRGNILSVAETLGHKVSNEKDAVEILRNVSVEDLYSAQIKLGDGLEPNRKRLFSPVIEEQTDAAFLCQEPLELLTTGEYNKVPMIVGCTNKEGLMIEFSQVMSKDLKTDFAYSIPRQLNIVPGSEDYKEVLNKIKNLYNGPDQNENAYQLFSDTTFVAQIIESLKLHLKTGIHPIYMYIISLETELSFLKKMLKIEHLKGVSHGDDVSILFKIQMSPAEVKPGSTEETAIKRYVKLVTNFAKHGNPTPSESEPLKFTWQAVKSGTNIEYLNFGEELVMESNPEPARLQLWNEIFEKYPLVFSN